MSLLEICRWWSGHPPRTLPNVRVDIQFSQMQPLAEGYHWQLSNANLSHSKTGE